MPLHRFVDELRASIEELDRTGTAKGHEAVVTGVRRPQGGKGPRFLLQGHGDKEFLRMNSNSYLGLSLRDELLHAEEEGARKYGVGPGAVRFISGTYDVHVKLEEALAAFHGREAAMLTSAAYTSVMGVIVSLTTEKTVLISDELNHNCIVNAMKLARPAGKKIYKHNDLAGLERALEESVGQGDTALVITDGVFSMRGDYAPLKEIRALVDRYDAKFPRNVVLVVDDSHGAGAYGTSGRGTEEITGAHADVLVATLGKAFGVNGGYICATAPVIRYLREKNPFYIYSNPITPAEAQASLAAVELVQSGRGRELLAHLSAMTAKFEKGLTDLGFETIGSPHPVTPLVVRDTDRTNALVRHLRENGVLATGLNYPVVPRGDQLIRFQVSADHTSSDIDAVLSVLKAFRA
jgi:glycine C-acetyltransferase